MALGKGRFARGNTGFRRAGVMNRATPAVAQRAAIVRKNDENAVFAAKFKVLKCGSCCGTRGWRFSRRELCENQRERFAKRIRQAEFPIREKLGVDALSQLRRYGDQHGPV